MAGRRSLWPLLVYGAFVAIAAARRGQTEGARESGGARRQSRPAGPPEPDESDEAHLVSYAASSEVDKRPLEQFENDQPLSAQLRRAKEPGRGRRATAP